MFAVSTLPAALLLGRLLFRPLSVPHVLLAAVAERFKAALRPGLILIAVYFGFTNRWHLEPFPAKGSVGHFVGDSLAAVVFSVWIGFGVLLASGFTTVAKDVSDKPEYRRVRGFLLWDAAVGSFIVVTLTRIYAGPMDSFGLAIATAVALSRIRFHLGHLARVRRYYAPVASDCSVPTDSTSPYLLHLSDLHLTATGAKRTEGGASGNANLAWLGAHLAHNRQPKYLMITGDVVDTGRTPEWSQAIGPLRTLRERGIRVLICPGNHDLATAYDDSGYLFLRQGALNRKPYVNASTLVSYLELAVTLEPELCAENELLSDILEREVEPARKIAKQWQRAADVALGRLTAKPSKTPPDAAREGQPHDLWNLRKADQLTASALLDPLIDQAMEYFSPPDFLSGQAARERWMREFTHRPRCAFNPIDIGVRWGRLWTQVFPLHLFVERDEIEFFVVNSVAPDPGALASAFGRLTAEQISRLERGLTATRAKVAVILMHHPICGWQDEPRDRHRRFGVDIQRWGLLAHDVKESEQLVEILNSNTNGTRKQTLLCVGHRHGLSRAGPVRLYFDDPVVETGAWVLESAALPDVSSIGPRCGDRVSDLIVCMREASGLLRPCRMPFSAMARASQGEGERGQPELHGFLRILR